MTQAQRRTAKWVVASGLLATLLLSGALVHTLSPVAGDAQPSGPNDAYVVLHIPNRTGAEVCGLNLTFVNLPVSVGQALAQVSPFRRLTPSEDPQRITLREGCLRADEAAVLQFVPGVGPELSLASYAWIKTGDGPQDVLLPGTFEGVFKEVITPRQPIPVLPPEQEDRYQGPWTTFSFTLKPMPRGRLLVTQGMVLFEGQPVAIVDQERQRELTQALNAGGFFGKFRDRQRLQRELDELTIYSPFSGKVTSVTLETDGARARVTLELDPTDLVEVEAVPVP